MRIIIAENYDDMSRKAANIVAAQLLLKPDSVLGLATGSTPLGMYRNLVKMYMEGTIDFSEVITFNLDEYVKLSEGNENSYHYYMWKNFFGHINISKEKVNIPDGMKADTENECKLYENLIASVGGLDLQVLGIGNNGHIGFNEPDLKFESTTHIVRLEESTIKANSRFFEDENSVPKYAITMGIKTIMHAKKVLLLASGENKAEILYKTINGLITPETPASVLQLHPDVTIIADKSASKCL